MNMEISETRQALNAQMPPACDCTEIKGLANAYDEAVSAGTMTHDEAVIGFGETIRPDCQGKVPREEAETGLSCFSGGCGVPEKVCKHSMYLIGMAMKVRPDTTL